MAESSHICLIGNTGSGKTTVANRLSKSLNLPLVSSGNIARELSEGDPTTDMALRQGIMAPEAAMRTAVRHQLEAAELQSGGWILEGFPRLIEQAICLATWTNNAPMKYYWLDAPPWICVQRLIRRGREDDNPDSIARKLASFEAKTMPMIDMLDGLVDLLPAGAHSPHHLENEILQKHSIIHRRSF